jgi:hypothetical protein
VSGAETRFRLQIGLISGVNRVFGTPRLSVQVEWSVAAATAFTKEEKHSEGRR